MRIIGEGDERPKLEAEILKHKLDGIVELLGARTQSDVAEMLPAADCYIQSSVSEGIPVALMEAMACELPVVATRITGIPELVLDGKTGLLVPPGDIKALSDALIVIRDAPEIAKSMGKVARSWVMDEFDLEKNSSKLASLFCSVN
jgi:glycosyltransferase involved in cell wall biosynthesis